METDPRYRNARRCQDWLYKVDRWYRWSGDTQKTGDMYETPLEILKYTGSAPDLQIPDRIEGKPVRVIADEAFANNPHLRSAVIPDSVEEIGNKAFFACGQLSRLSIPSTVERIGEHPFASCDSLTEITVRKGNSDRPGGFFDNPTIIDYFLEEEELLGFRESPFADCPPGTRCVIKDGIERIGQAIFRNCRNLAKVYIPDSVKGIEESAFKGCSALREIWISAKTEAIHDYAFSGCSSLESIHLPEGITHIGSSAFEGCGLLREINLPGSLQDISADTFSGCDNLTVCVGKNTFGEYFCKRFGMNYRYK